MNYIWNRADRVDPKLMPDVLRTCFISWQKSQLNQIDEFTSEKRKERILFKVKRQRRNLEEAVRLFNNKLESQR